MTQKRVFIALVFTMVASGCEGPRAEPTSAPAVQNRGQDKARWWEALPRPAWSKFRKVGERQGWFEVYEIRPGIFAMFERSQIERLIQEHGKGVADHSHKLWGLLCLSLWWQQFMEKRPEDPTPIGYGPRMIATPSS